jgi:hypothetical protein
VIKLKYNSIDKIDRFIDGNLFAFPYIDDVKEALDYKDLKAIYDYADELKETFKYLNHCMTKEEREQFNFSPRRIKHMFDCIMFCYYEEPFFNGLNDLMIKHGGYARDILEDFIYKKAADIGHIRHETIGYLEEIRIMTGIINTRNTSIKIKR